MALLTKKYITKEMTISTAKEEEYHVWWGNHLRYYFAKAGTHRVKFLEDWTIYLWRHLDFKVLVYDSKLYH